MAKVKCAVCANESSAFCTVKKVKVNVNKPRNCEAYVFDEKKLKEKKDIPRIKVPFKDQMQAKEAWKKAKKEIKELKEQGPAEGTAKKLGLIPDNTAIKKEDFNRIPKSTAGKNVDYTDKLNDPKKLKHPLTGDLSMFTTTSRKDKEEHEN